LTLQKELFKKAHGFTLPEGTQAPGV
jgi:hypothetical protein